MGEVFLVYLAELLPSATDSCPLQQTSLPYATDFVVGKMTKRSALNPDANSYFPNNNHSTTILIRTGRIVQKKGKYVNTDYKVQKLSTRRTTIF
ncbi:MAG: hypothetical protein LBQ66_10290 [Planctomycetaceae bacterium]|nr:hypothetical protein [Planctomycetaceae bacterium]